MSYFQMGMYIAAIIGISVGFYVLGHVNGFHKGFSMAEKECVKSAHVIHSEL